MNVPKVTVVHGETTNTFTNRQMVGWKVFVGETEYCWCKEYEYAQQQAAYLTQLLETGNDPFGEYCEVCNLKVKFTYEAFHNAPTVENCGPDCAGENCGSDVHFPYYGNNFATCTKCDTTYTSYCGVEECCPWEQVTKDLETF